MKDYHIFERSELPYEMIPEKDDVIVLQTPTGEQVPSKIIDVDEKFIKLDMNYFYEEDI